MANTITPVAHAAKEPEPVVRTSMYATATTANSIGDINSRVEHLADMIKGLEDIADTLTGGQLEWLRELKEAFKLVTKIINGGLDNIVQMRSKIIARVDLLINVSEAITADATELIDSEQQAHVIIGFSVIRALVKATDLLESAERLNKASENLKASLEQARKVPKLTENSRRTHYTLEKLNRAIARAKELRDKEFKQKLDPTSLAKINLLISKAQAVRDDRTATVGEVKEITNKLNDAVDEAYISIPEGERIANDATRFPLEKLIQQAENLRDFQLKGKVDNSVIDELNRTIYYAQRVLKDRNSTINKVIDAKDLLDEALTKAKSYLEAKEDKATDKDSNENIETPDKDSTESIEEDKADEDTTDKKLPQETTQSSEEINEDATNEEKVPEEVTDDTSSIDKELPEETTEEKQSTDEKISNENSTKVEENHQTEAVNQ